MVEKVVKQWFSITMKIRILFIVAISIALIVLPIVAFAGSGITFSNFIPANGTTSSSANPTISVKASTTTGTINSNDVTMTVEGQSVTPSFNSSTQIISYTPTVKLKDQSYSVVVGVYDTTLAQTKTGTWSFTIDAAPNPSSWKPAKDSIVTKSNPEISLYVKDISERLNINSVTASINGQTVPATLKLKGYIDYDYDTGEPIWVVQSEKEGTITLNAPVLNDGKHDVVVRVADINGNVLEEKWSFIVKEGPTFSNILPIDKSEQKSLDKVSATITDNEAVNWNSVKLLINGKSVTPITTDPTNKTVNYNQSFTTGVYNASLQAEDEKGNSSTKNWNFVVDSSAPEISYLYDFDPSKEITNGILKIRLGLKDLVDIKDNVSMKLDNNPLNISFRYDGELDYYGDYIIRTKKEAHIEYQGTVTNGNHTLTLYTEDKLGNSKTYTWNFAISAKPIIADETPFKYGVTDLTPKISATVKSTNGTIKADSIILKIDGIKVNHLYDASTGKVTYTPSVPMNNESYHEVSLEVKDSSGLGETRSWKFYTSTYPDMSDSNISNCTACHALKPFTGSNGNFEEIHANKLAFDGNHTWYNNRCDNCHTYISQPADCSQCHATEDFEYAPHGSTPDIKYTARNNQQYFPLRVTTNREMWDCIICHQPGAGTKGYVGHEAKPSRLLNNHDIPELHKTSTQEYDDCTKCHALSLTREHAREGRVDKAGKAITCKTCHEDDKLKPVIDAGKKDCASCHSDVDHKELHTYKGLNSSCVECHSNGLTEEHSKIEGFTCANCHESEKNPNYSTEFKQSINLAIIWNQLSCSNCHSGSSSHGVAFAKNIPEDLKYSTLAWMIPESLDFWAGEDWVPNDMAGGLYTLSKRKTNLSGLEVFNYYQGKMTDLGWVKASGPAAGSDKFELVYTNGKAKAIIRFYNTEHYTTTTNLGLGHRIEVLYKYNLTQ